MANEEEDVFDDVDEEVAETTNGEEAAKETKVEKPKRTPEEDLAYFEGRAKRLRKDLGIDEDAKPEKPAKPANQKSDGLDLGAKAFLAANGIKGTKEYDFFETELKKAPGETVESLLENEYFQGKLEKFRALEQTAGATPTGDNRSGGAAIDSVEYWATKPFEEVPKDMRQKVVNYKLEKENNKGVFYNS